MSFRDRVLYHQIHPVKLVTDCGTAIVAAVLLWRHELVAALAVGFVPSIVVTAILLRWADLEPYRTSAFGRYIQTFMTRRVETARFLGLVPLWVGAWYQSPLAIAAGIIWILGCWLSGLWDTKKSDV